MNSEQLKHIVAKEAISHISDEITIGIGSGSTVLKLIELLGSVKAKLANIVSSSNETTQKLQDFGFEVKQLSEVYGIDLYIDGADEFDRNRNLIKGGGGQLTKEKILAHKAKEFICIVDESKIVAKLGEFPLPVEVIPMARSQIARELIVRYNAEPVYRDCYVTENSNQILDVHKLNITDPEKLELELNNIPGVVTSGLFTQSKPHKVLMSRTDGQVEVI